jgi:NADH:ubiquinone oxidoreductase subunit E
MTEPKTIPEIRICMGSSCFSRGNNLNLPLIQNYLEEHDLVAKVTLVGSRCGGRCNSGPNMWVQNELHARVTEDEVLAILDKLFK